MDPSRFDDILGKKLSEEQSFPFDENQWKEMEAQLDEKKKKRGFAWWFWGAIAASFLIFGFGFYSLYLNQKIDKLEKQVEAFQIAQTDDKNSTVADPPVEKEQTISNTENTSLDVLTEASSKNDYSTVSGTSQKISHQNSPKNPTKNIPVVVNNYSEKSSSIFSTSEEISERSIALPSTVTNADDIEALFADDRNLISHFSELESKADFLIYAYEEDFSLDEVITQPVKNQFKFKHFSLGAFSNSGWYIGNSNSFNSFDAQNATAGTIDTFVNNQKVREYSWQYGIRTRAQFSHGLGIQLEMSRKNSIIKNDSGYSRDISTETIFSPTEPTLVVSSIIKQGEWIFGGGITYSPFQKRKVRPYLGALAEFSWNISRDEGFEYDPGSLADQSDPNFGSIDNLKYTYKRSNFGLRNFSAQLGIEGEIANRLHWQIAGGFNIPTNTVQPILLNRFQVGAGLNYIF